MNNFKKLAGAVVSGFVLLFVMSLSGGCATKTSTAGSVGPGEGGSSSYDPKKVKCETHKGDEDYFVTVIYSENCPTSVSIASDKSGCEPEARVGEKYPPVCLCAGKNERVIWKADGDVPVFTVHFSPFNKGSFVAKKKSKDALEAESGKFESIGNVPPDSVVVFKYSISAGPECPVLDPPFIIKQ